MDNIEKKIVKTLVDKFGIKESAITLHDSLDSMGMDSIAITVLECTIMDEFGLKQEDWYIDKEDSVSLLRSKLFSSMEAKQDA